MTTSTTSTLGATARRTSPDEGRLARLATFVRTELAPTPARWRATLRLTLSCMIAAAAVMTLRVPYGHWLVITIFLVAQPNVGASIDKAILRLAGTVVGAAGVVVTIVAFPQQPWFFIPLIALLIFLGAFLSRTVSYPYVALLGSITVVLFVASSVEHPALAVTDGLWRLAAVALAEVIVTTTQLVLWPEDPEELLLDDFVAILGVVDGRLGRVLQSGGAAAADDVQQLRDVVFNGLARHMDLLGNAETRYRALRRRHTEQLVLIGAVNRIAVASLTFETLVRVRSASGRSALDGALRWRIDALRGGLAEIRRALVARRPLAVQAGRGEDGLQAPPGEASLVPPLVDMERALEEMRPATAFLDRSAVRAPAGEPLRSPLDSGPAHFFTPACSLSNTRDLRFAAQVTLAAMICYFIVTGLNWPGIQTALITCLIVAQSSFGATMQKAQLRLAGAVLGGLLGVVAVLLVVPNFDSLPPFLIAVGLGSSIAAYVATGSARSSYVGIQIAFAFAMCTFDTWGPTIELTAPRDRVIGILLGNVVVAAVMFLVWPVLAAKDMVRTLDSSLRHMAQLSLAGVSGGVDERVVRPARGFRLQIFQDIAATLRMHGESQFEPGAATPEHRAEQERLLDLLRQVQSVFPIVLGLVRNRLNASVKLVELPVRARMHQLALAVAPNLEAAADELLGRPPQTPPALAALIAAAEADLAVDAERVAQGEGALAVDVLRGQIELYRELAPQLDRLRTRARAVRAP